LRAAAVRRTLTVTVPARSAVADPVATTTGLPLRLRILAATVPEIFTVPARATLTSISTPLALASAAVLTVLGHVRPADRALRGGWRDHDRRRGERARVRGGCRRSRHLEALVVRPGDAASAESEASVATPVAGMKQSTANVGG